MANRGSRVRLVKKGVDRFCGVCGESDGREVYKICTVGVTASRCGGDGVRPPNFARMSQFTNEPLYFRE